MTDMGGLSREVTPQGCRESVTFIPALTHGAFCGTGQTDILLLNGKGLIYNAG